MTVSLEGGQLSALSSNLSNSPRLISISFASSGIAQGLIANGLSYFLLIYYSQVLGLAPSLAGLAMMIALLVDAISDPLIGAWSDRTRSSWGRRHPFLFASILPISLSYYFLWDTPALSQSGLFIYMLSLTVLLRLSLTLHVVPYTALLPEITSDYEDRTRLVSLVTASSYFSGTALAVLMYGYWLADAVGEESGSGILRQSGYIEANFVAACIVFFGLSLSALGTFKRMAGKKKPHRSAKKSDPHTVNDSPKREGSIIRDMGTFFVQAKETLNDRNFFVMVVSGLASAMAVGSYASLWAYMQTYFWGFSSEQMAVILISFLVAAVLALLFIPVVSKGREKKCILIWLILAWVVVSVGPVILSLNSWFPVKGSSTLLYTMIVFGMVEAMLTIKAVTISGSMIADIVDARAVKTQRREEGLLLSVISFIGKVSGGAGVLVGGFLLSYINFPVSTAVAEVPDQVLMQLGWLYVIVLSTFHLAAMGALYFYRLTRAEHVKNIHTLKAGNE